MINLSKILNNNNKTIDAIAVKVLYLNSNPKCSWLNVSNSSIAQMQIKTTTYLTSDNFLSPSSTNPLNKYFYRVLSYRFSSNTSTVNKQQSQTYNSNQQTNQSNESENVISVSTSKSTMLFMDSRKLSSLIRLIHLRNNIKPQQSNYSNQSFALFDKDQNQLSSFRDLDKKILTLTKYNEYLGKGSFQQYKDYPIIKLTQICLKFIQLHNTTPQQNLYGSQKSSRQHWKQLQNLIRKRMHNCSTKDYMKIVYIVLSSYHSIYKFNHQFIESLVSGLRKQVPLMEQQQLMQLFYIISHHNLTNRAEWESSLRFSQSSALSKDNKIRSPFYQHEFIYTLHEQILQKMVKRYQKKYMNTQLHIKQEQLFKACWWIKTMIGFRNQSLGNIKGNQYSSLHKNKFVVGMINVIVSKLHPALKTNHTHVIKGQRRQIQSKSTAFKSVSQMIEFLQNLSLVRDYLHEQGESGIISEGMDDKSKQMREKAVIWLQKSKQLNEVIIAILQYQTVKQSMQKLFTTDIAVDNVKQQNQTQQSSINTFNQDIQLNKSVTPLSINVQERRWRMLSIINQSKAFSKQTNELSQWYIKLIRDFKVFQLIKETNQLITNQLSQNNSDGDNKKSIVSSTQKVRLMKLGEYQLHILYLLFNNLFYIKKHVQSSQDSTLIDILQSVSFHKSYELIIKSCFYFNFNTQVNHSSQAHYQLLEVLQIVKPQTVLKMIHFEISVLKLNQQQSRHNYFKSISFIVSYSQQMLGLSKNTDSKAYSFSYYVRQLQFALYNYFTLYLNRTKGTQSILVTKIKQLVQLLYTRNQHAKRYLQQNNSQYEQMLSNQKPNPFLTQNKFLSLSTNNYRALTSTQLSQIQKHKLLDSDSGYGRQAVLLGDFIMKCIKDEKKRLLMNQDIVRLNKFFTQIKAFKQIRFCCPVTNFLICPQFIFLPQTNTIKNQLKQMIKALIFLSPQELIKPQILSLKEMYLLNGIDMITIDRKEFLDMHINERIQILKKSIFSSTQSSYGREYFPQLIEQKVY